MKNTNKPKATNSRSGDKIQTSIAISEKLLEQIGQIAEKEHRSRNQQIALFLEQEVRRLTIEKKGMIDVCDQCSRLYGTK